MCSRIMLRGTCVSSLQTQNMVVDLQHEVHFLNNQLHLILNEEEEDPEMLIEDNGWEEEEVELEDEDDPSSDLDSKHAEIRVA